MLEKSKMAISFDAKGSIESLLYNGKQFIGKKVPLFHIRLRKRGETVDVFSEMARTILKEEKADTISFSFSDFIDYNLKAVVKVAINETITWKISIENNTDYIVEWVGLPEIVTANDLIAQGGKARVLYGVNEGTIIEDVYRHNYTEPSYPSEGLMGLFPAVVESPFMAYYEKDGAGLYMGAHDTNGNLKAIDFHAVDNDYIKFHFRLYAAIEPNTSYEMPYEMVWQFFSGDWQDAAGIYRQWFEKNSSKDFVKIENDETLPDWYKESFVVLTYPIRGRHDTDLILPNKLYPYNNALPHIDRISKELDSNLLVLLMHWEGTAPWAPPYVWPPYGGEEEFKGFIEEVHARGHAFGVYCSGTGYTMQSKLMEYGQAETFKENELHQFMCLAPDGTLPDSHICPAQRVGYDMCISQDFTKAILMNETIQMAQSGIDYIQLLDQNHGGTPYFCYSETHGHPPVPGLWQVNEMKEFLQELLQEIKATTGKEVLLGCESAAAETYVPYLRLSDNRFNLNYAEGWPTPVYSYVYHEYVNNFSGNGVCNNWFAGDVEKYPAALLLRMAYSFVIGDLFTLVINENGDVAWNWGYRDLDIPKQEPIFKFVKDANHLRKEQKKYLCFGKMIKGPKLECGTHKYYGYRGPSPVDIPNLVSCSWEASDGSKAMVIANYLDDCKHFCIDLSAYNGGVLYDAYGNKLMETNGIMEGEIEPLTAYIVKFYK